MLSIDVAAILTVDTRPVPPDTSVITATVPGRDHRAGMGGSGYGSKALDPEPVIQARVVVFFGLPRWFSPGS